MNTFHKTVMMRLKVIIIVNPWKFSYLYFFYVCTLITLVSVLYYLQELQKKLVLANARMFLMQSLWEGR